MKSSGYTAGADKLGITSAVICTIHCLIVPMIFLLKYWWTNNMGNAFFGGGLPVWWEKVDYVFLIVGFIAVYHASRHAPAKGVKVSLWFFWLCLAIAIFFESTLHWLAYIASAGLVATHFVNIRQHRKKTKQYNTI